MESQGEGQRRFFSGRWLDLSLVGVLTIISLVLMLVCTSPEFSWDEADYVGSISNSWHSLWAGADYSRHGHGPLAIYLAKLGEEVLPSGAGAFEGRVRFFDALAGSLGIGFLYWILRRAFQASRAAALAGSSLLLFSVIRLEESNVVGPHHLMLFCTVALFGLGYQWRESPTLRAGLGLGVVMGFGALSMTYVIPAALCWALAITLAGGRDALATPGKGWLTCDRGQFGVSWAVLVALGTATMVVLVLWPPGVLQHVVISNFRWYLHYPHATTLVGDRIYLDAPRWAFLYWLGRLDAPILLVSLLVITGAVWRTFKQGGVSSKHIYLAVCLAFFLATALAAHISGSRNLLQFIGVLCLATGALYDEAFGDDGRGMLVGAVAVVIFAAVNLAVLSRSTSYIPYLATDGFRAFFSENQSRLQKNAKALVFNTPAFRVYAQRSGTPVNWVVGEITWSPRAEASPPADTRYVLMSELVYGHMPPEQPMRRVVADHWKVVWSHKGDHAWELRLYENPEIKNP